MSAPNNKKRTQRVQEIRREWQSGYEICASVIPGIYECSAYVGCAILKGSLTTRPTVVISFRICRLTTNPTVEVTELHSCQGLSKDKSLLGLPYNLKTQETSKDIRCLVYDTT